MELELEVKRWGWSRDGEIGCFIPKRIWIGAVRQEGAASYRYGDGGIHGLDNEIVILVGSVYYFRAHLFSCL